MVNSNLAEHGARLLGGQLQSTKHMAGGCVSECLQITLADGRVAVVKNGPSTKREADMLRAIAESGAPAPAVLAADEQALVMELLPNDGNLSGSTAWASLGSALAKIHAVTGQQYGWQKDYAFGEFAFSNAWSDNWPVFWAERRLLPHIAHCSADIGHRVEELCADLATRLPAKPRAALLHGDFWTGNVLVSSNATISGIIDPACYYGHTEVDFAMLTLFSRPNAAFYTAYGPLEEGYAQRQPIYQLWPALVHLRLFGSAYRSMVEQLLAKAGV